MRLLLTRPRPQSEDLAEVLTGRGYECLIDPVMTIRHTSTTLPDTSDFQAVIVTSGNGAAALAAAIADAHDRRGISVWCVGTATRSKLWAAGFEKAEVAGANQAELVATIRRDRRPEDGPLLHAGGVDVAGDLAGDIAADGFEVRHVALYEAVSASALAPETLQVLRGGALDGALLFSPRTARILADLADRASVTDLFRSVDAYCLSRAVGAEAASRPPWRSIHVAARPTREDMLALLPDP